MEVEFLHPRFVGRDGCALDADAVFLNGLGRLHRDSVFGGVAALDSEVEIIDLNLEIRKDQLFLDEHPHDPGHFVAVDLDDRTHDLDFIHFFLRRSRSGGASPATPTATRCRGGPYARAVAMASGRGSAQRWLVRTSGFGSGAAARA